MHYPAKQSGRADPRNTCQNKPKYPDYNSAVIYLSDTWYQKTQNSGKKWFTHRCHSLLNINTTLDAKGSRKIHSNVSDPFFRFILISD